MENFSPIIDSLRRNDPVEARKQVRALLRSGNLAEEHWTALYGTLRLTTTAIEGRGHYMYADTKKAWSGSHTAQALEELTTHLSGLNKVEQRPVKTPPGGGVDNNAAARKAFSLIIDSLLENDTIAARKQLNIFMRSGKLPQKDWLSVHSVLLLMNKAIDGRGDFMHADTRKAWWVYYTAQALEELRAYLGINEVVQFPVETLIDRKDAA
jgi:hypothetical protein